MNRTETSPPRIERGILLAGLLVLAGLMVQVLTLLWNHPLAFLAFLGVGVPLTAAGVLLYLYGVVFFKGEDS
jgi:hypothetical protein